MRPSAHATVLRRRAADGAGISIRRSKRRSTSIEVKYLWPPVVADVNLGLDFEMSPSSLDRIYREEFGRILATLIRLLGDFDIAEEAAQEAFAAALEQWPR